MVMADEEFQAFFMSLDPWLVEDRNNQDIVKNFLRQEVARYGLENWVAVATAVYCLKLKVPKESTIFKSIFRHLPLSNENADQLNECFTDLLIDNGDLPPGFGKEQPVETD